MPKDWEQVHIMHYPLMAILTHKKKKMEPETILASIL